MNGRRRVLVLALAMASLSSACSATPETFVEWCASVPAEDCLQMASEVAAGNLDPACVIRTDGADEASACFGQLPPQTTVPNGDVIGTRPPRDAAFVDQAVEETLLAAHPEATVDVGVIFVAPVSLAFAQGLADGFETEATAVWRADQVCVPAWGGFPGTEPSRFAWINGVERASAERRAAEEGRTVVTGHQIAESAWSRMEQEAAALRPDTELVAMAIELVVGELDAFRQEPAVARTRIIPSWVDAAFDGDVLPAPAPLSCEG